MYNNAITFILIICSTFRLQDNTSFLNSVSILVSIFIFKMVYISIYFLSIASSLLRVYPSNIDINLTYARPVIKIKRVSGVTYAAIRSLAVHTVMVTSAVIITAFIYICNIQDILNTSLIIYLLHRKLKQKFNVFTMPHI